MIPIQEIWAEWFDGEKECIDTAENESEAICLVSEYKKTYGANVRRVWIRLSRS